MPQGGSEITRCLTHLSEVVPIIKLPKRFHLPERKPSLSDPLIIALPEGPSRLRSH